MDKPRKSDDLELGQITTEWSLVHDSIEFVSRYGRPIQKYLACLIRNKSDAEEVAQDFLLWVTRHGFPRAKRERGRFRDYLKVAVRNYAIDFLRRNNKNRLGFSLDDIEDPQQTVLPDHEWNTEWGRCLLNRVWATLEKHQNRTKENIYYTALRLSVANPKENSTTLASKASFLLGMDIRADAFRKQLSRARRLYAEYLVSEVAQTLDNPKPDLVEEELVDLGLMVYVRDYLPGDWQARFRKKGK
jgi:hypothetical protein